MVARGSGRSLGRAASLANFEVEEFLDVELDSKTALGEAHHFHRIELVARRTR